MLSYHLIPEKIPSTGILYVDHEASHRSGHLSHALVEYKPGQILSFYSNCSPSRRDGHNGFGWIEYRRSTDGGRHWEETRILEYSRNAFLNEPFTVSCEKAVSVCESEIILFCTRNTDPNGWEPWITPTWLKSTDGGNTWKEMGELWTEAGRVYDALTVDGRIYALMLCNPGDVDFCANKPEHHYQILESTDGGESFHPHGRLPGELLHRGYGNMELTPDGSLICYTYNLDDEYHLDTFISPDFGLSWSETGTSFCAKRIRNPQVTRVKGGYILHGRSGTRNKALPEELVLYTGEDGIHWDEGTLIGKAKGWGGSCFYSENLVLHEQGHQRILIQSSISYDKARTNIAHWILEID